MTRKAILNFDIPGFILFAPAAIQFFLALQWGGNTFAWNSRQVIGLFCGAAATFILWLFWDYHHGDNAMIPFSVMRKKVVWVSAICGSFFGGTIFVTAYYLPIYFQSVRGEKPFISGVDILPNILTQMVVGLITGITSKLEYLLAFENRPIITQRRIKVNLWSYSPNGWILPSIYDFGSNPQHHRMWAPRAPFPIYFKSQMGRLPDNIWRRSWVCSIRCKFLSSSHRNLPSTDENYNHSPF